MAMNNMKSEDIEMTDMDMLNSFDFPLDENKGITFQNSKKKLIFHVFFFFPVDDYDVVQSDNKTPGEILDDFCSKLQDVNSTIPDPVMLHYMKKAGFIVNDPKLVKILSLASQKFISEIINDCMQFHKIKTNTKLQTTTVTGAQKPGLSIAEKLKTPNSAILTLDDLSTVLQDYGISVKKPYYFM
jgi:transcription initiation factor TFIID subunit 10